MTYTELLRESEEIERELEELRDLFFEVEDEEEADRLYGRDIAKLEAELDQLQGEMYDLDVASLTRDYYASVL